MILIIAISRAVWPATGQRCEWVFFAPMMKKGVDSVDKQKKRS
jgi:hypothetical protein